MKGKCATIKDELIRLKGFEQSKNDYRWKTNLSSNESHSTLLDNLFSAFLKKSNSIEAARYPYYPEYELLLAERMRIDPGRVTLTAGSDAAIFYLLLSLSRVFSSVLIVVPNYSSYDKYAHLLMYEVEEVSKEIGLSAIMARIRGATPKIVVMANPNGYDGAQVGEEDIIAIANQCSRHGGLLVLDEAYSSSVDAFSDTYADARSLIVLRSFSKFCGMAGLRIGMVISEKHIASLLKCYNPSNSISSISLAYLGFFLAHYEIAQKGIVQTEKNLVELQNMLEHWADSPYSYANFALCRFRKTDDKHLLLKALISAGIVVKDLKGISGFEDCLRITAPSETELDCLSIVLKEVLDD